MVCFSKYTLMIIKQCYDLLFVLGTRMHSVQISAASFRLLSQEISNYNMKFREETGKLAITGVNK